MSTAVVSAISAATPFPGLRPFRAADASFFFGRDEQIEALLNRLATHRLLAVVGTSGSGKSSLVGAGLIPTIQSGHLGPTNSTWLIANIFRPGTDPLAALAHALTEAFSLSDATQIKSDLLKSSAALSDFAKSHLAPNQRLLVFVDQFEELFRYREQAGTVGRDRSTAFVKLLLAATGNSEVALPSAPELPPVYVVLTMRSDYLGKCAQFRGLPEALNDAQYLVPRLSRDQLRETIEGPIALAGATISNELVVRLLNETGDNPDMLPLLQHALARLWEESKGRAEITLADYQAVGEIGNALNLDADNAFAQLDDPRMEAIVRRVFQRLVEPGAKDEETRKPTRLSELALVCAEDERTVRRCLKRFANRGFIIYSDDADPLVDISHESLIRQWKKLKDWVAQEEKSGSIYRRLAESAANRRPSYRGGDLAEAIRWEKNEKPNASWALRYSYQSFEKAIAFLQRSRRMRKLLQNTIAFAVLASIAVATLFFYLYRQAEDQKHSANSLRLVAQAQLQSNQSDLALLLGVEAYEAADNYESRNGLFTGTQENQSLLVMLSHKSAVFGVALSPDGKLLASASEGNTVRLWDVATRQPVGQPLSRHTNSVMSVAFSPDGKLLASASFDKTVRLWNVATRQPVGQPLAGHTNSVMSVAFSPDGKLLASASMDNMVRLWDVATRQPAGEPLAGHTNSVTSVAFSPDGKLLASASMDSMVRLWDVATGQPVGEPLAGHMNSVTSVAFSPDGKLLASASDDKTVRLWDVVTRQPVGQPLTGHMNSITSVAFSPDGNLLASSSWDKTVRLWDVATRVLAREPLSGHTDSVMGVAFSPDGKLLASASKDNTVRLWDAATRQPAGEPLSGHTDSVMGVAFSPDGKLLASASEDKTVRLWDVGTRQPAGNPLTDSTSARSVAFSPDGKLLATATAGQTVRLWDVATRRPLDPPLTGHTGPIFWVAFSPDSKLLASASEDHTVRLWDVATRDSSESPLTGHPETVYSVAFSPDGKLLATASGDSKVRLWDVATRQPSGQPLSGHTGSVMSVAFSPDGKLLASASEDSTVRLWDVATHQPLGRPLSGHSSVVNSVAFSPNRKLLASASADNTIRLWDTDLQSWIARTCAMANRNLSLDEWRTYIGTDGAPYRKTCPLLPPGEGAR